MIRPHVMNASFRTAFWAMCLGLTVPMVLLVGVELTSGGRGPRKSSLAADDSHASLRSQWESVGSKSARREMSAARGPGNSASPRQAPGNHAKPHVPDPTIVLGPLLEVDQSAVGPEPGHDHRIPALVTGNHPRADVIPDDDSGTAATRPDNREIETRLANIQSHLDRLGRALADRPERESPADPVKQAAELLKQLQQARELDRVAAQFPRLAEPEPVVDVPGLPADEGGAKPADSDRKPSSVPKPPLEGQKKPRLLTKIYRPRHLSGSALSALVAPLLTPEIGKAGASDAGTDESARASGGPSSPAPVSALVVRDYPEVLRKIDLLVKELDVPPIPVMIEATAVTVSLGEGMPQGIDLEKFNAAGQSFVVTPADGVPASVSARATPPAAGAQPSRIDRGTVLTHGFGLKCGVLQGDPRAFLSTLEAKAQTRRTSASQINVLNHQSAQIMLNDRLGPEASDAHVTAGTILKVCPNVVPGGFVHLDVRREVEHDDDASASRAAALTHQIVLREGQTAIVGGFYAEHPATHTNRAPGTGQVRVASPATRPQSAVIERSETIIILTPHVVRASAVEAAPMRRADVPPATSRGRPAAVQQASGTQSIKGQKLPRVSAPNASIRTAHERPAVNPSVVPGATSEPPRRLPAESIASVRPLSGEATVKDTATDLDAIPVLELPGDGPGPAIRPAGAKRGP